VGETAEPTLFAIVLDTTAYCLDGEHHHFVFPILTNGSQESYTQDSIDYVELNVSEIPPHFPDAHRRRLTPLLSFVPHEHYTDDLVHLDSEQCVAAPFMQARPWEWLDQAELHPESLSKGVKNNTSIAFDTFNTKMTWDHVIEPGKEEPEVNNVLATFQDSLHSEPLFERDWRETRLVSHELSTPASREPGIIASATKGSEGGSLVHGSPAASTLSRSSGASSVGSWKQSPSQRAPSIGSVVEADSIPSIAEGTRAGKRKAAAETAEANVTQAAGKRPRGGKTTKTTRGRGKKK
jgi:hypothetical protein